MDRPTDLPKKTYEQFLEEKHSGFNTPRDILETFAQKAVGSGVSESEKIIAGEVNEVYSIKTVDNNNIVVRISHGDKPKFKQEKFALDKAREAGVPTPIVYLIDKTDVNGEEISVCVEEKLPGKQLSSVYPDGKDEKSKGLVIRAGAVLSRIHSVDVARFGALDENGIGRYDTWEEFMLQDEKKEPDFIKIAQEVDLDPSNIRKAFEILRAHRSIYSEITPQLLHGDFSPKHLLVEDENIAGVIDMEDCKGGDIARDFAWWEYFYEDRFPIEWLMEGYGNPDVNAQEFRTRMNLCGLQIGISLLYYYKVTQNENGLNHTKKMLIKDFEKFD